MKPDIKLPTKEEKIEQYKKFGKKYVFPERLAQWNQMVEDTININMDDALKIAASTMRDLEDNVNYDAIEFALGLPCSDSGSKSIIFNILLNYAKKGPDFLINTELFRPNNKKELMDWAAQVAAMRYKNKQLADARQPQ